MIEEYVNTLSEEVQAPFELGKCFEVVWSERTRFNLNHEY
jgi:hypothetical protein